MNSRKFLPTLAGAAALLAGGLLASAPAEADTFDLTSDHCTGGYLGGLTSAGTVTVTQAGTNQLHYRHLTRYGILDNQHRV
jgi:hypothetical protein